MVPEGCGCKATGPSLSKVDRKTGCRPRNGDKKAVAASLVCAAVGCHQSEWKTRNTNKCKGINDQDLLRISQQPTKCIIQTINCLGFYDKMEL